MNHLTRTGATGIAALLLTVIACTPRSTHQAVVAQLETCATDLDSARIEATEWKNRFDTWESQLSQRLAAQETATATSMDTIQMKFQELRAAVPQTIQTEIGGHINELERLLVTGISDLTEGNQALQGQLDETRTLLEDARRDVREGNEMARAGIEERRQLRSQISDLTGEYAALVERIHEFDRTRLQCKKCPEYLDLRSKKAADIAGFHDDVVETLYKLQAELVGREPTEEAGR